MKRTILLFVVLIVCLVVNADGVVKFSISDGIDSLKLKAKIERNLTRLLNEINNAYTENHSLDFSKMEVNESVKESITMLWENTPFMCTDDDIIEHCITTETGYQIRNIPLMMKPIGEHALGRCEYNEAVISFDKQGNIESFHLSVPINLYMNVIKSNLEMLDLHRRQVILDYVEHLRTAYGQRDICFLSKVYANDGLKKGKLIKKSRKNKKKHLSLLRRAFKHNQEIKVKFDDIEVMRHPVNPNFYGVTLLLGWSSGKYYDDGYLFLLWDFSNENAPQILVRTWQPDKIGGKTLSRDEVYSLSDFDIN